MKSVKSKKSIFLAIFISVCLIFISVNPVLAAIGLNVNYSTDLNSGENLYYGYMTNTSLGNLMLLESPITAKKFMVTGGGDIHAYRICYKDGSNCYDISGGWSGGTDGYIGTSSSHTASGWLTFPIGQGMDWDPTGGDDAQIYVVETGVDAFDLRVLLGNDQASNERFTVYTNYWDGTANDRTTHYFAADGSAYNEGALSIGSLSSSGTGYFGGNVGIKRASPANKLHVTGNIGATGWIASGCETNDGTPNGYVANYSDGHTMGTSYSRYDGGFQVDGLQVISADGYDIDLTRGDSSQIHSVGMISLDGTSGSWDSPDYHGITSKNESGTFTDELRVNSYNSITNTIDSNNNNGISYFKVQEHSTGNGTDLFWVRSADGYAYYSGNVGIGAIPGTDKLYVPGTATNDSTGTVRARMIRFYGTWGNSGQAHNYYGIYQETGTWAKPLVINYRTGIKYVGYHGYGGHRFYVGDVTTPSVEAFSTGNTDYNTRVDYNLYVSGNAGIGTTNTQGYRLYVNGLTYAHNGIQAGNAAGNSGALLTGCDACMASGVIYVAGLNAANGIYARGTDGAGLFVGNDAGASIDGNVRFADGVGIGTTDASTYILYAQGISDGNWLYRFNNDANGSNVHMLLANYPPAPATPGGYGLHVNAGSNASNSTYLLQIYNTTGGTGNYLMEIEGNGEVGIGTINPTQKLHVVGNFRLSNNLDANALKAYNLRGETWGFCGYASGLIQGCASDGKLKENIETIDKPIEKLEKLRGVYFNWKKDNDELHSFGDERGIGLIAQEVEEVFPEIIGEDPDGYKTTDYSKLTSFLIEVNKNQQLRIDELRERIEKLKEY